MADTAVAAPANQQEQAHKSDATTSILSRLRLETRAEHEAVEQVLDLMSATLTCQGYRQQLEQFYGFYKPLEKALHFRGDQWLNSVGETPLSNAIRSALAVRLDKTTHLQQDLYHLGVTTDMLPLCTDLPPLNTQAEVLGCLYVIEGATLGGRLIARHLSAALGVTPMRGGRFFEGYGDDTSRMWQGMRQLLVSASPNIETENSIVTNAIGTFACLRGWCESFQKTPDKEATRHA